MGRRVCDFQIFSFRVRPFLRSLDTFADANYHGFYSLVLDKMAKMLETNLTEAILTGEVQLDAELIVERQRQNSHGYIFCKPTHVAIRFHPWRSLFTPTSRATTPREELEGHV